MFLHRGVKNMENCHKNIRFTTVIIFPAIAKGVKSETAISSQDNP